MQEDNLSDITLTPRIPSAEENPFIPMAQKMAQPDQLGLNAPTDNPFLAIAKGMGGEGQPPAIGSIASTLSINPDQAAQASKLGGQFGLGQDIALRNMDELRRRSLITRLQQTGMLEKNPALAESLANPAFSAQAHDDIDNLAETGSWIDSISKGFEGGFLMQEMGELRFSPLSGERFYGATPAQQERMEQVRKRMQETQGSGILYMTAQVIAQQLAQAKGIGTAALTGFGIGAATGGAPGAVAGGGVGAATGVVLTTAQMEAGLLYDELEQAGVDPETATTAAVIGGTINGAIELLGAKAAAAPFRPLIRKLIADRVEALAMPTMRSAAKGFAKGYATQVGTETLEETVQEITAMATSEIAKAADGIDSETTWTDALTRITDAAIGGFQGSLLLGGIGPGANAIVDTRRAKQTEAQQKWLDGLQERVADSKVRERNPNAFQEFVEKQVEGKPVATIYVDAEEAKGVLAQLNLTASQVDAIVPGFAEQVRAESERGGDVTIPTALFSARLANTDLGNALRPHMRLSPEALSVTQLEAVRAERERMSAAGQDVIDERMAAEDTAFVDSAQRVEETMYGELIAAGQPATEAKINAEFVRNMMASLADRVGVTPEQMFERYPYRVRGEGQAAQAQALEQAVQFTPSGERRTDTPEFKAWFRESKVATAEDKPLIVYHGTASEFNAFDPREIGATFGIDEEGFYFTNSQELADRYAQRAKAVREQSGLPAKPRTVSAYVSLNNPWIIYADMDEQSAIAHFEGGKGQFDRGPQYLVRYAKESGYDGLIVQDPRGLENHDALIIAFDPTQIKSPDNSGTWSRTSPNIFEQAAMPMRLMAVHNLSADNLAFAEQMGGLAVPSIGVITEERGGVEGFGEITLIGTQEMADPATSRVFSSDAYSARFPRAEWPKVSSAKADKFVSQLRDVAKRFGDDRIIDQTFDAMVNSPDAQKVVGYWLRSMPVGALFLSEKGIDIAPTMRERKTLSGLSWEAIDKLRPAYEAVDQQVAYDEMENSTEYRNLQDQYAAAIRAQYASVREDLGDATIERWATGFTPTTLQRLSRDMGQAERQTVDDTATRSAVDAAMEPFIAEFKSWVDTKVRKQFGDPFIRIGRSRKPYTLSNIVDVMTSTKVRGEEKGMTFGAGAARAEAATEFVDLEQMRETAQSAIVDPDEYSKAAKKSDAQLSAYRDAVIEYTTLTDWRGKSDTWAALDGSMRALATYGSRKRRDASAMRRVLAKEGFASNRMPNELIEQAIDAAEALFNAPVPYFEAKPQRAVRIGEFAGAVIPSNATQETRDILDRNGVRYMTYLAGDKQDRQRAVREMARSPEAAGQTLFQAARGLARGGFDPQKLLTTLNKDADFSTFAHETAHYFLTILGDVAARPDAPASVVDDMNTLLRWFGVKDLATWNAMSLDQQRQYHEQFAYSFETYLFEGKAPSVEMQGLFDQFARWLKQVYQGLITKINDVYKAEFGKDLPILTGEVRQVMDRMLATEDQIARAQAIREMKPQFQTQEQSGMDDATWAAYQELQEQATERAVAELTTATLKEMAWMSRARGRKLRELQRQHDDKRKEIKDEVTEDLRILPVYRAMEFLKRGKVVDVDGTTKPATGQFKLSVAGVQAVMPPGFDVATLGRGRYGMVNEDGLHPDLIAPLYGYANGAELVTALSTAKPFADAVAERTDQRMLSEFSELADPAARSLAVDRAIHNEARARLIAVEQRWAAKLQQPVSVIMEAASQVAGEIIGRQTIRTLSPRAYAAAEARAARLATSAYTEPQSPEQAGQTAATRAYNEAIAAGRTVDEATAESLSAGVAAVEKARERRAEFDKKYGGKSPAEVMMRAKRQQLLQNMLARQALEARAEIDRARSAFKRFFGSDEKIGKTRNMEMVSAARAILGWYGFGKRDKSPAEYVDQLKAYNPAAYAQLEPLILRATRGPQDYRDLTVDEFRVLRDTVDGLWIQARKDKQVKLADRTMALDEVVGELDKRLEEIGVPKVVPGEKRAPTFRDRAARHLMTLRSTMRRVESWADGMDGVSTVRPFTNYLVRPVLEAVDKFTTSRNKYMKRFRDLVVGLQMPEGTISAPELDYTFGAGNAGIGKAELLGALLHTGNESNYRKLLLGRGWGQEDEFGNLDDTQFKAFVKRMQDEGILTKSDYDFLQAVWDLNEEIKPIAQKAHYELYGFYFTEIPASEVETPFGTYRGGYVPAATDKFMVADAAQRAGEEELESDWRNSLPSTGRGFTKARMAGYNKALSLDVRVIGAHIDSALRFSMIQPAITQALRILRSREFAARLDRVDPTVKQELLIPWLNRTARQLVSQPGKYKAVDSFWRGVRTRTGMSIMFANLRNALQQFTGLFPAGLKVQPRYLTSALTEYVGSPQRTANSVAALSPFMEDRLKGQSFEMQDQINEVLLNPSRFDRAQAWTDRHGYFLQQAFQNMVDVVTWVGAYNQSLSTADTTVTAEEAQREAIAAGDAAVRLTQGSVRPSDVSAFESGTPFFRTLTQFAGYFNMLANLNSTEYVKVIRDMGFRGNKGKLVYIYMMGFMLPAVVADAIVRTLGGGWDDEDEDGYLDTFMDWFFGSQIRQGVAFVPFGTTAYTLATTAFDDKPYNDRMTTSPSVAALEAATVGVGKAAIAVVDEEKDVEGKNVRDVLTFLSLATGIPFSVLGRPAGYLVDVQRGEVEPTSTYDMIRGTITGTATPESKR